MNEHADAPIHPLNAIAEQFKPADTEMDRIEKIDGREMTAPALSLLKISSPAILLDQALQIVWQNNAARQKLWHITETVPDRSPFYSIFDLLFEPRFQNHVDNWKQWLRFFLEQARSLTSEHTVVRLAEELPDEQRQTIQAMLTELTATSDRASANTNLYQLSREGDGTVFEVVVTRFETRSLMVFEPRPDGEVDHPHRKILDVQKHKDFVHQLSYPTKMGLCVLSAGLNDADTLRTEMLDEEFSQLLLRIWGISAETVEENGGIIHQSNGTGLLGYFLPTGDSAINPMGAIQCALELKRKMSELGREWKIRKGWLHDIDLNMGIHAGYEFIASVPAALGNLLLALGETLDVANCLSTIASNGQIWTTKAVIQCLPEKELKHLRFGIFRSENHRQVFIARYFSRIRDLSVTGDSNIHLGGDMGAHAVTQIFDRQGHG